MRIGALLAIFLLFPGMVFAQEETAIPSIDDEQSDIEIELLVDQELGDEDLTENVAAETLPSDGFRFVLENALFNIRRAFTFQAERKVMLDQERLQKLDRKLTACAEIGDTACVDRLQEMIMATEDRAQRHFERKQEVLGNIEANFEAWRQRRQEHIDAMEEMVKIHEDQRDERLEELKANREQAKEDHKVRIEELREQRQERINQLKTSIEERKQNREHLIELRSKNVSDRLEATRERAADRQTRFDNQLEE